MILLAPLVSGADSERTDPIWFSHSQDGEWQGEGDYTAVMIPRLHVSGLAVMTTQILPSRGSIHSDCVTTVQFRQETLLA